MSDKKQGSNIKSADDLIVKVEAEKLGKTIPESKPQSEPQEESETPKLEAKSETKLESEPASEDKAEQKAETESQQDQSQESEAKEGTASKESPEGDDVDEYGTKVVGKKKLYTEEEVNRMMRERFKRGQHSDKTQEEIKQAAKDFQPDPDSNESWENQLAQFIDSHLDNKAKAAQEKEWKAREEQSMAEFEVKFSEGMTNYKDFQSVVANKPITQAMMLATRSMENPAAFLYAACKQQPKEIQRIASIADPLAQAVEIGKLEEKMRKAKAVTSAPKPAKQISGDASDTMPQLDIDARIAQHAKTKIMGHRR